MTDQQIPPQVPAQTTKQALAELEGIVARANAVQVTNADEYAAAVQICQQIAANKSRRTEERLAITRKMDEAKRAVMDFFSSSFLDPLDKVDAVIRGKLKAYNAEQQRIADEARRKAEAEARRQREEAERKAREAREKAEAEARQQRQAAERQRQEEERARREAEELRAKGAREEAEAKEKQARDAAAAATKAESKAEKIETRAEAKVEQLTAHAESIVAPVVLAEKPKVAGSARRTVWKWRVVDASKVDRKFLQLDETKIGQTVRAMKKDAADVVGGIEVYDEEDVTIRAAKS